MNIADEYFNRCKQTVMKCAGLMGRMVRYQDFSRESGIVVGCNKAVKFLAESTYGPLKITGLKDGDEIISEEPVLITEGIFEDIVTLETTRLGFESYSGGATTMRKIVVAANGVPVIDMSARHYPWQIIEEVSLAAYIGGAKGTSTQEGYDYVKRWHNPSEDDFKVFASLPHAQAAFLAEMAETMGYYPSVLAAILFEQTHPGKPITVLVDYEGMELYVAEQAFDYFGDRLFAVRLDTHGGRNMQGTFSVQEENEAIKYLKEKTGKDVWDFEHDKKYFIGNGVTVEANYRMREFLDSIGAQKTKIVVSSGFNEKKVKAFVDAKAPMDFIGTGSWVNFMMFTSDISHVMEKGVWVPRTKVGRIHKPTDRHTVLFERK